MRNIYTLFILCFLLSCSDKDSKKEIELKEKELELREREISLKEAQMFDSSRIVKADKENKDVQVVEKVEVVKTSATPEALFQQWEKRLISIKAFDYVNKRDCNNSSKMSKLYEQGKYPMHTSNKSILDFNDGKGYLINYTLLNCVGGNGWSTDFIFLTSENGVLRINEKLTNQLKTYIYNYVKSNYGNDAYVYKENNFIVVKSFEINRIMDDVCYGNFTLMQDGASCCPEISGDFSYDLVQNQFSTSSVKRNVY